jgi:hypothetical protein
MNRRGEAFEIESGLPESEVRAATEAAEAAEAKPPLRWFEFCRKYVAGRWRTSAAKTRESMADGLAAVALAMVQRGMTCLMTRISGLPSDGASCPRTLGRIRRPI